MTIRCNKRLGLNWLVVRCWKKNLKTCTQIPVTLRPCTSFTTKKTYVQLFIRTQRTDFFKKYLSQRLFSTLNKCFRVIYTRLCNKKYHTEGELNASCTQMYRLFFEGVTAPVNGQLISFNQLKSIILYLQCEYDIFLKGAPSCNKMSVDVSHNQRQKKMISTSITVCW